MSNRISKLMLLLKQYFCITEIGKTELNRIQTSISIRESIEPIQHKNMLFK